MLMDVDDGGQMEEWLSTASLEPTCGPRTPSDQSVSSVYLQSSARVPDPQSRHGRNEPLYIVPHCHSATYLVEGTLGNSGQKSSIINACRFESRWLQLQSFSLRQKEVSCDYVCMYVSINIHVHTYYNY